MDNHVNIQQFYTDSSDKDRPFVGEDRNYSLKFPEGLPVFKLVMGGTNVFDIVPFKITNPMHPLVKAGKIQPDGSNVDDIFMYWEHRDFNGRGDSCLCMNRMYGERCFVCDEQRKLAEMSSDGWKSQRVKDLFPKSKVIMNVIDWRHRELGIQVFTGSDFGLRKGILTGARINRDDAYDRNAAFAEKASTFELKTVDRKSKTEAVNEYIYFASPVNGYGIEITTEVGTFVTKSGATIEFAKPNSFVLRERAQQYTAEIVDSGHDLVSFLNIPVYEELQNLMYGAPPVQVAPVMETRAYDSIVIPPMGAQQFAQPNVVAQPQVAQPVPLSPQPQVAQPVAQAVVPPVNPAATFGQPVTPSVKEPVLTPGPKVMCSYNHVLGEEFDSTPECVACQKEQMEQYITCIKTSQGMTF